MKENILYANIIHNENLLIEVVYMMNNDIKYQQLTLHGKPSNKQDLITSTLSPTEVNIENGKLHLEFSDQSTQSIELNK